MIPHQQTQAQSVKNNAGRSSMASHQKRPGIARCLPAATKKMKGNEAIIRIARKLLRRMRAVLISGVEYQKGVVASKA